MILRTRRRRVVVAALMVFVSLVWYWGNDALRALQSSAPSRSRGSTTDGSLANGKRLPSSGVNFHTYSRFGSLIGRTAVHSTVQGVLLASFARLVEERPGVEFIVGETGWPSGGPFPPHRTHENGTSVDLFVPVIDRAGRPAILPTWPWLKFGYAVEFDSSGRWRGYRIDFETLAAHLLALEAAGRAAGAPISRVILDPRFQDELGATALGRQALATLPWMQGRPWVRHDEHYHVDFGVSETDSAN